MPRVPGTLSGNELQVSTTIPWIIKETVDLFWEARLSNSTPYADPPIDSKDWAKIVPPILCSDWVFLISQPSQSMKPFNPHVGY